MLESLFQGSPPLNSPPGDQLGGCGVDLFVFKSRHTGTLSQTCVSWWDGIVVMSWEVLCLPIADMPLSKEVLHAINQSFRYSRIPGHSSTTKTHTLYSEVQ